MTTYQKINNTHKKKDYEIEDYDLLRLNHAQIYQPNSYEEQYYQKQLTNNLNIFDLEFKKNITQEPVLYYYSQYNTYPYETQINKINNIVLNLLNNYSGRCYKNVIYMLFICNPIF